ncbi:endo-1,4-beta-xylanase A precursor [Mycena vulgaris]|nr:endo-1,4-beta-xylanase A precursor [Mycena vulgaris]
MLPSISFSFAAVLVLLPTAIAQAALWAQCGGQGYTSPTVASSTAKANAVAKSLAGKLYLGSATDNPELNDTAYVAILSDNTMFGQITPGNSMKWDSRLQLYRGDVIAALAKENGRLLRGHNCVWYNQLPAWVTAENFNATTLQSILQTHCSTVVRRYAGQVCTLTHGSHVPHIELQLTIRQPFNDDGTLRAFVFPDALGISPRSQAITHHAAKINDYNIETAGAKSAAMINLVKALKAAGAPIDGIGIQGHLIIGQFPSQADLIANFQAFTALGLEIAITELDIRTILPQCNADLLQQRTDYQTIISACKAVAGCVGVTLWDYTDKYSWIPSVFADQGRALPWNENLIPKPAYDGIIAGFTN